MLAGGGDTSLACAASNTFLLSVLGCLGFFYQESRSLVSVPFSPLKLHENIEVLQAKSAWLSASMGNIKLWCSEK